MTGFYAPGESLSMFKGCPEKTLKKVLLKEIQ